MFSFIQTFKARTPPRPPLSAPLSGIPAACPMLLEVEDQKLAQSLRDDEFFAL